MLINRFFRKRLFSLLILGVSLFLWTGCGLPAAIDRATDAATRVVDNAIMDLNRNSADWQNIVQGVARDLPDDVAEIVREEAQNLATRSIAQAGAQFSCMVDHYANRAEQALRRLRQILDGESPDPLPPMICLVAPAAIDLNTNPSSWDTITIHGYDLDHLDVNGDRIAFAMWSNAQYYDSIEDSAVGRTTHYQITYSVRKVVERLYDQSITKIIPQWEGTLSGPINGEVLVNPWRPSTKPIPHEPNGTTHIPQHVGGDKDFDTDGEDPVRVEVKAYISNNAQFVFGAVYMYALELTGDNTEVQGLSEWVPLYEAPRGWKIIDVTPSSASEVGPISITSEGVHDLERPGGEVVVRFTVQVDHDGNEAGDWTRVTAVWNKLNIEIEETQPSWYR
jgi:hypothetical protein